MTIVEAVIEQMQTLPISQQQQVLEFAQLLVEKHQQEKVEAIPQADNTDLPLGERLSAIRQRAIAEGMTLEPATQISAELSAERDKFSYHENPS